MTNGRTLNDILGEYTNTPHHIYIVPLCSWTIGDMLTLANLLDAEILKCDCERARPGGQYDDHC